MFNLNKDQEEFLITELKGKQNNQDTIIKISSK
jgi:hypothetical protein